MAKLTLNSTSTGSVSFDAPVTTENTTITVPAANAGMQVMTLATAQNTTSGTSIDFTGIPSWVKKITVMFYGVSTNGTGNLQVQLGAGSVDATAYTGEVSINNGGVTVLAFSTGFLVTQQSTAASTISGLMTIVNVASNTWIESSVVGITGFSTNMSGGSKTLSGTLDRIRITTVNGTDLFDAGSVNILYEGY